jgi:hypothetical protein
MAPALRASISRAHTQMLRRHITLRAAGLHPLLSPFATWRLKPQPDRLLTAGSLHFAVVCAEHTPCMLAHNSLNPPSPHTSHCNNTATMAPRDIKDLSDLASLVRSPRRLSPLFSSLQNTVVYRTTAGPVLLRAYLNSPTIKPFVVVAIIAGMYLALSSHPLFVCLVVMRVLLNASSVHNMHTHKSLSTPEHNTLNGIARRQTGIRTHAAHTHTCAHLRTYATHKTLHTNKRLFLKRRLFATCTHTLCPRSSTQRYRS